MPPPAKLEAEIAAISLENFAVGSVIPQGPTPKIMTQNAKAIGPRLRRRCCEDRHQEALLAHSKAKHPSVAFTIPPIAAVGLLYAAAKARRAAPVKRQPEEAWDHNQ